MPSTKAQDKKIKEAAEKMAKSPAFQEIMRASAAEWEFFLSQLDPQAISDVLLLLDEEERTYEEIKKKAQKRHEVNKTKLLHRLEKTRVEAQQSLNSSKHGR